MFCNPEIIEKIAEIFEICNCDAVYGDLEYVSKTNIFKVIRFWKSAPFDFTKFKKGWMPAHPTLFIKKKVYDQSGRYDTNFKISADYDFILRTLPGGTLKCQYLPMVITRMRSGGTSNKNLKNILRKSYEDWLVLRKNNIGGMMVLIRKNTSKLGQFILKK
jgi:glycosyltransferase